MLRLTPPPNAPKSHRDAPLEGLRGLCALLVVYAHITFPGQLDPGVYIPWMAVNYGPAAVYIFFVISGYVIGLTVRAPATPGNVLQYCRRRLIRIVPIAWFAVLLSVLLRPAPIMAVIGNLLFLQNGISYPFGIKFPTLHNNFPLWSLTYEAFFYVAFIAVWKWAPRPIVAIGLTLLVACAYPFGFSRMFSFYAFFSLLWLSGLMIAWLSEPPKEAGSCWPSAIMAAFAMWTIGPCQTLFSLYMPPRIGTGYCRIDFFLASAAVILAVTRRSPAWQKRLVLTCIALGLAIIPLQIYEGVFVPSEMGAAAFLLLALVLRNWRPAPSPLAWLAPVGEVSYALYVTAYPLMFVMIETRFLPSGSIGSFILRLAIYAAACGCLAWFLERVMQPRIARLLGRVPSTPGS